MGHFTHRLGTLFTLYLTGLNMGRNTHKDWTDTYLSIQCPHCYTDVKTYLFRLTVITVNKIIHDYYLYLSILVSVNNHTIHGLTLHVSWLTLSIDGHLITNFFMIYMSNSFQITSVCLLQGLHTPSSPDAFMKVKTLWSNTLLPKQLRMWHQLMAGITPSLLEMTQLRSELNTEVLTVWLTELSHLEKRSSLTRYGG